jgi:hypothetical protein
MEPQSDMAKDGETINLGLQNAMESMTVSGNASNAEETGAEAVSSGPNSLADPNAGENSEAARHGIVEAVESLMVADRDRTAAGAGDETNNSAATRFFENFNLPLQIAVAADEMQDALNETGTTFSNWPATRMPEPTFRNLRRP